MPPPPSTAPDPPTTTTPSPAPRDIDHAIRLLHHLKKTATPAELVSLHRALLPTEHAGPAGAVVPAGAWLNSASAHTAHVPLGGANARRTIGHHSAHLSLGQPWTHRAAHLSHEYLLDCDIASTPYEEESARVKRLGTVHGEHEPRDPATGACADALRASTAGSDIATDGSDAEGGATGSAASSVESKASSVCPRDCRFRMVKKQDSGYCSEASDCSLPPHPGVVHSTFLGRGLEPTPEHLAELETPPPAVAPAITTERHRTRPAVHGDVMSRTAVRGEFTPPLPSRPVPGPDRPEIIKPKAPPEKLSFSPLALFKSRNRASRRASVAALETPPADTTARTIPPVAVMQTLAGEHAASRQLGDGRRRLQKRVPDAVRGRQPTACTARARASASESPASSPVEMVRHGSSTRADTGETIFHTVPPARNASVPAPESKSTTSAVTEKSTSRWRRCSKSFAKDRSGITIPEVKAEESPAPSLASTSQSSPPRRRRSRSIANFAFGPASRSTDPARVSGVNSHRPAPPSLAVDTTHKHFSSGARALDSTAIDAAKDSTRSAAKDVTSSAAKDITSSVAVADAMSKVKSSKNLRARASVDLSKSKNADAAIAEKEQAEVTPMSQMIIASRSSRKVEDFFPDWQGKPASPESSRAAMEARVRQALPCAGASEVASGCIPPLPELPADMDLRVSKAEEMCAKKLRLSPKPSPQASARHSVDSMPVHKLKHKLKHRPEPSKLAVESRPRADDEEVFDDAEGVKVGRPTSIGAAHSRLTFEEIPKPAVSRPGVCLACRPGPAEASSPTHDARHPGGSAWETQLNLWRHKRTATESAATLTSARTSELVSDEKVHAALEADTADESHDSPAIVVSRYITPVGSEFSRGGESRDRQNSAASAAESTSDTAEYSEEHRAIDSSLMRRNSMVSTATFVTMWSSDVRPAKVDVGRRSGASSTTTRRTTVSIVPSRAPSATGHSASSSPSRQNGHGGRHASPSHQSLPGRPTDAVVAERSGGPHPARRSCAIPTAELGPLGAREDGGASPPARASPELPDRYGGGLGYGWDREGGFIGSAGSRNASAETVNTKSVKMSEQYGIDLTDVPVFLQRRRH